MAQAIYRIELFRRLTQPRHTAYQTEREHPVRPHMGRRREFANRGDKPPPARNTPLHGLLNVLTLSAADFAFTRRIGRAFFSFRSLVRCRGPPLLRF